MVRATDSAGLVATKNVTILATRRPAGDWVTRLHYTEFGQLTAEDVQFLTNVQLASIPDYYWFSRMSGPARAALSATQVQRLTNLQSINTVLLLTQEQRAALTVTQVQALKFQDFAFLPALQISRLSSSQIASIPDPYWLGQIPASSRSALTGGQIVNLLNLKEQGMIALLTLGQRQSLTPGQLQTLTYLDFEYVPASQIVFLSRGQIASIPDDYWFARIGTTARAALTNVQVTSLFVRPQGMLSLLTSTQRNWLTPVQIQALTYLDFEYLPSTQIQHLSGMQIASIPDY